MHNIIIIAKHEFNRLFKSTLAWFILAIVQLILAIFFYVLLGQYLDISADVVRYGITEYVVANLFNITGILLLLLTPLITMRIISDERRQKTIQLLYSAPISLTELVLGKFLAINLFYFCALCMICTMPLSLQFGTQLDLKQIASAWIGLQLLVMSFTAIGIFISSLTANPSVAAISTFATLFMLWIINLAGANATTYTAEILNYLSLIQHYQNLVSGIFHSTDVLYYLIITTLFLALTIWRLELERVQG